MNEKDVRIEIYPNADTAAKLIAAYEEYKFSVVPLYTLIPREMQGIPEPRLIVDMLNEYSMKSVNGVVFIGLDAYLEFLPRNRQKDFFRGLRNLLETSKAYARFIHRYCYSAAE